MACTARRSGFEHHYHQIKGGAVAVRHIYWKFQRVNIAHFYRRTALCESVVTDASLGHPMPRADYITKLSFRVHVKTVSCSRLLLFFFSGSFLHPLFLSSVLSRSLFPDSSRQLLSDSPCRADSYRLPTLAVPLLTRKRMALLSTVSCLEHLSLHNDSHLIPGPFDRNAART
jgi:hypothetical protein